MRKKQIWGSQKVRIECGLNELGKIELVKINSSKDNKYQIWKMLIERYHYLGHGKLYGLQIRYLVKSEHYGWIGAMSFSSSAWRLQARDKWIGWNEENRLKYLKRIVCNSRFLIIPQVKVKNLASYVLSISMKQIKKDWREQNGIEPLMVETFVEKGRFSGTCYQAANFRYVGTTRGRGRQDRKNEHALPIKDVYLYPLCYDVNKSLCEGQAKKNTEVKTPFDWVEEEFGSSDFGDERLAKRLIMLTRDMYAKPQASIPQACGSRAKTKAAYRFFDHEGTTMKKIMQPHYKSTINRVKKHKIVLAVQDTTSLNYSAHPATEGLGLIASKSKGVVGLLVHDTMAFSTEGTPLGLLDVQCWIRKPEDFGKRHQRYNLPIEEKESNKWLKSFHAVQEAQKQCRKSMLVSVGDREADIYEFFELAQSTADGAKVLVRAEQDRLLADGQGHLFETVKSKPLAGIQELRVPRRGKQLARDARMEIRFAQVTLKPPKTRPHLPKVMVWVVVAQEVDAPEGIDPLEWILLTTTEVSTFEEATERLRWYAVRWGIEVYHRTLKSGCKIEERQLGAADRIESCLAIDMVIAWRIFYLTKLGRETPNVPCTVFFEDAEWKALVAYKTQNVNPPDSPPTLREATRMVASLGGFLGRKGDGEPGTKTLWLGLQRLDDITAMWKFMVSKLSPQWLEPVSSSRGYG